MKPVCSHHEIEITTASALESYVNVFFRLFDPLHGIPKNRFDPAFNRTEDRCGEFCSRQTDIAVPR